MPLIHRFALALLSIMLGAHCGGVIAGEHAIQKPPEQPFIPLHDLQHYVVTYMGITCGHMTLESRLDEHQGKSAYHIILRAWNSRFFNKIYTVDARIDSWIDRESGTTFEYRSVIDEKGETSSRSYQVRAAEGTVVALENEVSRTLEFEPSTPVLDPLAFILRLQALARQPGESVALTLLTTDGALQTVAQVGAFDDRRTKLGRRELLEVRPRPADGEMFSRKGEVSIWIDPGDGGRLYVIDFKLSFGHLKASLKTLTD